jgi:hypothetical protein
MVTKFEYGQSIEVLASEMIHWNEVSEVVKA